MDTSIKAKVCEILFESLERSEGGLTEEGIAERVGTSRMPVREVVQYLKHLGVVDSRRKRGIFLKEASVKELSETYDVRASLEGLGGHLACSNAAEEDFEELDTLVEDYNRGIRERDFRLIDQAEYAFHGKVLALSDNGFLQKIVGDFFLLERSFLLERTLIVRKSRGTNAWWRGEAASQHTHETIIQALRSRDPDAAENELRSHVLDSKRRLIQTITGLKGLAEH